MPSLFAAGSNARGQLANRSFSDSQEFQRCSFHGHPAETFPAQTCRVVSIATGANHTIVFLQLCGAGDQSYFELWGCGDGSSGQLGATYQRAIASGESPTQFRRLDLALHQRGLKGYTPKLVSASWETTYVALECDGRDDLLISMGANDFGDLGVGEVDKSMQASGERYDSFYIVDFSHLVLDDFSVSPDAMRITIESLDTSQHHVLVRVSVFAGLDICKTFVAGWGVSRHGQLGNSIKNAGRHPSYLSTPTLVMVEDQTSAPIVSISLGSQHTVFQHASGSLTPFGSNRKGQLDGLKDVRGVLKVGCTWNGTYLAVENKDQSVRVLATGSDTHGQLGRKPTASHTTTGLALVEWPSLFRNLNVIDMACGSEHILILITTESNLVPEVWGWGWNEHGNLGVGHTKNVLLPTKVWPSDPLNGEEKVAGIWAGCGTSWIYTADE